jgi:hypothetical protein
MIVPTAKREGPRMSREDKGKLPGPQLTNTARLRPPQYEQLKRPRFPVDPLVEAAAQRVREEAAQEQTPEATPEPERGGTQQGTELPAKEPVKEPTVTRSSSKRKFGRRRIEWPHLPEALKALRQKWPDINQAQVESKHIKFVIKYLRDKGDDVAYELTEAGEKEELQKRTIRRRIEGWLNPEKGRGA